MPRELAPNIRAKKDMFIFNTETIILAFFHFCLSLREPEKELNILRAWEGEQKDFQLCKMEYRTLTIK